MIDFPLPHGLHISLYENYFKEINVIVKKENIVQLSSKVFLQQMYFDCSILIISNTQFVEKLEFEQIKKFASACGYTKLICTISIQPNVKGKEFYNRFKDFGFTIIPTGDSSRHLGFETFLCYLLIKPDQIGYV